MGADFAAEAILCLGTATTIILVCAGEDRDALTGRLKKGHLRKFFLDDVRLADYG
jgi:hypothetical protein